jgi:hypothetical protein
MQVHEPPGAAPGLALVGLKIITEWMQKHAPGACNANYGDFCRKRIKKPANLLPVSV